MFAKHINVQTHYLVLISENELKLIAIENNIDIYWFSVAVFNRDSRLKKYL